MRVVSLLPSATEIVVDLGLGASLVGVTDECQKLAGAEHAKTVSRCVFSEERLSPSKIDELVSAAGSHGEELYEIDPMLLEELRPDVIFTQDLCPVCALPSSQAEDALARAGCSAEVVSLDPHGLEDVFDSIERVGGVLRAPDEASGFVSRLRQRADAVANRASGFDRPRVLGLEWMDPPWGGGHWVPEMIEIAGGEPVLAERGRDSKRLTWSDVGEANPDVIVCMPCSFGLDEVANAARELWSRPEVLETPAVKSGRVFATDAEPLFSRSGPRLVDGVEELARILHPDEFGEPLRSIRVSA